MTSDDAEGRWWRLPLPQGALLLLIVASAFGLRLAWVLSVHAPVGGLVDDAWYYATATNVAAGRGVTVTALPGVGYVSGPDGYQSLFWPPGYSLTLGGLFSLVGTSYGAARALNVAAGTLTVLVTFAIGARVYGRSTGLVAAALLAVYPASVAWSTVIVSETLFALPFSVAVLLLVMSGREADWRAALCFGLVLGYATIIRPQAAVVWIAALVFWWVWYDRRAALKLASIAAIGILVWVGGISAWNSQRSGAPQTISTNAAFNLRIGHSPDANGQYRQPRDPRDVAALTSPDYDAQGRHFREAARYAATHPVREIELSALKAWHLYVGDSSWLNWATAGQTEPVWGSRRASEALVDLADAANIALLLMVAVAAPWSFSRRDRRLALWLILAGWTGVHIVFFSDARFHIPVLPVLATMAAVTIVRLGGALARSGEGGAEDG